MAVSGEGLGCVSSGFRVWFRVRGEERGVRGDGEDGGEDQVYGED